MGSKSLCFCGHKYAKHTIQATKKRISSKCNDCPCKEFRFVPQRPEECGMYWLPRRKEFKVSEWKAKCKCKLPHDEHKPVPPFSSKACQGFYSDFACISCDCRWEDHITLFEFEDERRAEGKKVGPAFMPLSMNKELQDLVFHTDRDKLPQYNRTKPPALPAGKSNLKSGMPGSKQIGYGQDAGGMEDIPQGQDDRYLDPTHHSNYLQEIGFHSQMQAAKHQGAFGNSKPLGTGNSKPLGSGSGISSMSKPTGSIKKPLNNEAKRK